MSAEVEKIKYTTPSRVSRYKKLTAYRNRTNIFFENPSRIVVPEHVDDTYFAVVGKYIDRLDLIAHKFYQDSKLWWVIAKANNIENPWDIPIDTILRIPATATLYGMGGLIGNG